MTDLVTVTSAVSRIGKETVKNTQEIAKNDAVTKLILSNIDKTMGTLLAEVKTQKISFDSAMVNQRDHIENKISQCYKDMLFTLKDDYVSKDEALLLRNSAIAEAKEERQQEADELEAKIYKTLDDKVGFMSKVIAGILTAIAGLALSVDWIIDHWK